MSDQQPDGIVTLKDGTTFVFQAKSTTQEHDDVAEQLREYIRSSGLTEYHVSKISGVPRAMLNRFMAGADMRLATFSKVAHVMGLELKQNPRKAPKRVES